ncbi:MAG: AarF/ABC1/UbiB kinase family protein [Lachnospiraceae bacterium]|nr:AarF/ABC1/UbiB kinase family protein [Lachnospiraceae bacterium]
MSKEPKEKRLREMLAVIHKHNIARGVTPEKLRLILEDLGPTYIKLGQIMSMRSDIFPKKICDELMRLRSDVTPMPYEEVKGVIAKSYGREPEEVFAEFEEKPIGSASIAQVHRAKLQTGEDVVVKVQREGIYETMSSDIAFLHRAVRMMPPINMTGLVDMTQVLDEMWVVAQEEMNFLAEAANIEEFARLNESVAYVGSPVLYREYTTTQVLVMEYIDGFEVDDAETLLANGYDLDEIGTKMADNYIKQIVEDGFFHADPHPGNLRIRDGKIIWIDMGMMGRFNQRDRTLFSKVIRGIADHDVSTIVEAVLSIVEFRSKPDQKLLYSDISDWLTKYGSAGFGDLNMGALMQDLMDIMKANKVTMPSTLTMLVRGLTTIEGVISQIAPDTNVVQVAAARMTNSMKENFDWRHKLEDGGKELYRAVKKGIRIPGYISDLLRSYMSGQVRVNLDLHSTEDLAALLNRLVRDVVMGFLITGLLIGSSILCTTDMKPKLLGIPALGMLGFLLALILAVWMLLDQVRRRRRRRR